jgi:hypothetical protein
MTDTRQFQPDVISSGVSSAAVSVAAHLLGGQRLLDAAALDADWPTGIGVAVSDQINPVLGLPLPAELLKLLVVQDATEKDDTGPLEVLPVERLRYLDCTDVGHGDYALE